MTFVNVATGEQIAASDMPLDQLPDTFALDTKLDLAGVPYVVVRADPLTKVEFAKTKRLSVGLRRVETLDPKKILFSLPTISGAALPRGTNSGGAGLADVVVLHEDDWRQCEFVSSSHSKDISAELAAIERVRVEAAAPVGWRKIHLRERISRPLPNGVTWDQVAALLGDFGRLGGVAFGRVENGVAGAVGARLPDGVMVWGVLEAGSLSVLCVEKIDVASATTIAALKRIADDLTCVLINWCRCQTYCREPAILHSAGTL